MKRNLCRLACILAITGTIMIGSSQFSNCWASTYTASNYNDVYEIGLLNYDTTESGSITVNNKNVSWWYETPGQISLDVDNTYIGTFDDDNLKVITDAVATALGIEVAELYVGNSNISGASQQSARIVFDNLIIPSTTTKQQKEKTAALKTTKTPRSIGSAIRYEKIIPEYGENGEVIGLNIGMAWDKDNLSYGFMLPYDNIEFDNLLDANRIGGILFGQYSQNINDKLDANYTAVINYMNTSISYDNGSSSNLNSYGGGLGGSITFSNDPFESSIGMSYMYSMDDSNGSDDDQHLIKIGFNNGFMISDNKVINVFGNWTRDVTDYTYDLNDSDYFQAGIEFKADFTDTWSFSFGFKELFDYSDMDSHEIYLGSIWQF